MNNLSNLTKNQINERINYIVTSNLSIYSKSEKKNMKSFYKSKNEDFKTIKDDFYYMDKTNTLSSTNVSTVKKNDKNKNNNRNSFGYLYHSIKLSGKELEKIKSKATIEKKIFYGKYSLTSNYNKNKILKELENKIKNIKLNNENKNIENNNNSNLNNNKKIGNKIGDNFDYTFLIELNNYYNKIIQILNFNYTNNKLSLIANYSGMFINKILEKSDNYDNNNFIGNIFEKDENINKFLNYEFCLYLLSLFINEFKNFSNNDLKDLINCFYYCHCNFLSIISLIIKKTENELKNINNESFLKLKNIIEKNNNFQDNIKFINEFNIINKIIKNLFLSILTKLSYINNNIIEKIQKIFYFSKDSKYIDLLNNYIKENTFILDKIDKIYNQNKSNDFNYIKSNFNEIDDNNNELLNKLDNLSLTEKKHKKEKEQNLTLTDLDNLDNKQNNNYEDNNESEDEDVPKIKPKPPFLPPKSKDDKREYTLVLDLDETLVHYCEDENDEENAYVKVRRNCEEFINTLSQYCEIIIFTASTKYYADIVIDGLKECNDKISGRLYRQHTDIINGFNVKDLSKLGRDLSKIIIVDNIEENFQLQPTNGLNIIDFEGEEEDNELEYLKDDLLNLVSQKGLDVRNELNSIRKAMLNRYSNCLK